MKGWVFSLPACLPAQVTVQACRQGRQGHLSHHVCLTELEGKMLGRRHGGKGSREHVPNHVVCGVCASTKQRQTSPVLLQKQKLSKLCMSQQNIKSHLSHHHACHSDGRRCLKVFRTGRCQCLSGGEREGGRGGPILLHSTATAKTRQGVCLPSSSSPPACLMPVMSCSHTHPILNNRELERGPSAMSQMSVHKKRERELVAENPVPTIIE